MSVLGVPPIPVNPQLRQAESVYDRLHASIAEVEAALEEGESLRVVHVTPSGEELTVTGIGYRGAYRIWLVCLDGNGNECAVIVHVASVHLVLRTEKVERRERTPIGFFAEANPQSAD
jgi:hypothetical protein